MTTDQTNRLLQMNGIMNHLMDIPSTRTAATLRSLEIVVRAWRVELEIEERRQWQAEELKTLDAEPVKWFGDIGQFVEDLVYHAKRLGRDVRGEFNGTAIVARPDSAPCDLQSAYMRKGPS